jgi:cytochrome b pre-mRNA-processing protein 3
LPKPVRRGRQGAHAGEAGLKPFAFKENRTRIEARAIVAAVTAAARLPALFGPGRAPDTFDGRFQMATLHAVIALRRLRGEPGAASLTQRFLDMLFRDFDAGLREAGVGDLSVPRHMKKIARAFYGRLKAYDAALSAGDRAGLAAALSRNIWDADQAPFAPALAERAAALAAALAAQPLSALSTPRAWHVDGP